MVEMRWMILLYCLIKFPVIIWLYFVLCHQICWFLLQIAIDSQCKCQLWHRYHVYMPDVYTVETVLHNRNNHNNCASKIQTFPSCVWHAAKNYPRPHQAINVINFASSKNAQCTKKKILINQVLLYLHAHKTLSFNLFLFIKPPNNYQQSFQFL